MQGVAAACSSPSPQICLVVENEGHPLGSSHAALFGRHAEQFRRRVAPVSTTEASVDGVLPHGDVLCVVDPDALHAVVEAHGGRE